MASGEALAAFSQFFKTVNQGDEDLKPMSLNEDLLSEELMYRGNYLHVYRETVRLPNGETATRDVVRHPGAVAIVPILPTGEILMVRQYRLPARRVLLEIPAGKMEVGEEPQLTAERECQEETGFKPRTLTKIGGVYLAPGYSTEFIHFYLATDLVESRLPGDDDEFLEVDRVPVAEALKLIRDGTICDAKSIAAILQYVQFSAPTGV